jgi:hypothetical protein
MNKNVGATVALHVTSASPWSRKQASAIPVSERKHHSSEQPSTEGSGTVLWPPDKNVHLQIPSYPKSIWHDLRIKNKCVGPPLPCTRPLAQALTCFHEHSGWSPDLFPRRTFREREASLQSVTILLPYPVQETKSVNLVVPRTGSHRPSGWWSVVSGSFLTGVPNRARQELRHDIIEEKILRLSQATLLTWVALT